MRVAIARLTMMAHHLATLSLSDHAASSSGRGRAVLSFANTIARGAVGMQAVPCEAISLTTIVLTPTLSKYTCTVTGSIVNEEALGLKDAKKAEVGGRGWSRQGHDYNHHLPHGSLSRLAPNELAAKGRHHLHREEPARRQ